ncbi:hypothetical protein SAMN02745671_01679 [Anaerovibrio lipolyticus DSM 3074]|uniref:Uncharacterized protein n=2 Tax=Anaerovibrio lipolyticus TaxID=82374 RepID=A0A0B2JTE5_9FIRM|nr:hypothetical protein [Anaerovibrio lipolyticus]KHM51615.1 hypothetical protein NZ47_09540 [Anaerovibrio lipolyticus]SHI78686.1 hypothetical protein SAMN02745671_01679 [Anaerovibrio lipolyticus DSM 3074]
MSVKVINTITTYWEDCFKVCVRECGDCLIKVGYERYLYTAHLSLEELKSLISVLQTAQYTMEQGKKNV